MFLDSVPIKKHEVNLLETPPFDFVVVVGWCFCLFLRPWGLFWFVFFPAQLRIWEHFQRPNFDTDQSSEKAVKCSFTHRSKRCTFKTMESGSTKMEGISRMIWSKLPWQKHSLVKMSQHPVQFVALSGSLCQIHNPVWFY